MASAMPAASRRATAAIAGVVCALASACGGAQRSEPAPPRLTPGMRRALGLIAAREACARLEGQFRVLADIAGTSSITGTFAVAGCRVHADRSDVHLQLDGTGWQWLPALDSSQRSRYQRFSATVRLRLALRVDHDGPMGVFVVRGRPPTTPEVTVRLLGAGASDRAVSAGVAATVGAAFTRAIGSRIAFWLDPEALPDTPVPDESLVTAHVERCRAQRSFSSPATLASTQVRSRRTRAGRLVDARLYGGGLLMFGPLRASQAVHVRLQAQGAAAPTARLLCEHDAAALAAAYLEGREPASPPAAVASVVVHRRSVLRVSRPTCRTVLVVQPADGDAMTVVAWHVASKGSAPRTVALCASP